MAKKKSHGLLIAVLLGAAGFVAGLLTAPKSGKQTRDEIVKDGKKVVSTTKQTATAVKDKAIEVKKRSESAVNGAKKAYKKPVSKKSKK